MGRRYIEVFHAKRSDYYNAVAQSWAGGEGQQGERSGAGPSGGGVNRWGGGVTGRHEPHGASQPAGEKQKKPDRRGWLSTSLPGCVAFAGLSSTGSTGATPLAAAMGRWRALRPTAGAAGGSRRTASGHRTRVCSS